MGLFGSSTATPSVSPRRIALLEQKVDAIMAHLGIQIDIPDDGLSEVWDLAERGQKIEAIKRYRELTGVGLAEAKRAVEQGP